MVAPSTLRTAVIDFCAEAGADAMLVQGAGGNVSWKDGDTLWVKASGMWLAEAARTEIFVPVELARLRSAIGAGQFDVSATAIHTSTGTSTSTNTSALRPSIETVLHAIMPQRVVVHLHAIEVLAHLVREDWRASLDARMPAGASWACVPYAKPGAPLASAVAAALAAALADGGVDVLFLQSHGVVLGADDVGGIVALLAMLTGCLTTVPLELAPPATASPSSPSSPSPSPSSPSPPGYAALSRAAVQALATDARLYARLASDWALYPDHVVFLGASAPLFEDLAALDAVAQKPDLAIVRDVGVFATPAFGLAKQVQLDCYFDVLVRQHTHCPLAVLDAAQIGALLNWDCEQYRMGLAK